MRWPKMGIIGVTRWNRHFAGGQNRVRADTADIHRLPPSIILVSKRAITLIINPLMADQALDLKRLFGNALPGARCDGKNNTPEVRRSIITRDYTHDDQE
jgi:hypothetical protein